MDQRHLEQLAEKYLLLLGPAGTAAADAVFHDDFTWHFGATKTIKGLAAWRGMVDQWLIAFPDLSPLDTRIITDPVKDSFAVYMRWTGTHSGDFDGIAATGRIVINAGVSLFQVQGGKVAEEWIFEDSAHLVAQLS